ncbi:MAG: transposase, partial [Lachnospiraceae bacterium]|nr:transposase [Lachnospiraceae bacterium]
MSTRKYPPDSPVCGAVYDNAPANNPFLAAMPEMLPREEFINAVRSTPGLPYNLTQMSLEERRQNLTLLSS